MNPALSGRRAEEVDESGARDAEGVDIFYLRATARNLCRKVVPVLPRDVLAVISLVDKLIFLWILVRLGVIIILVKILVLRQTALVGLLKSVEHLTVDCLKLVVVGVRVVQHQLNPGKIFELLVPGFLL